MSKKNRKKRQQTQATASSPKRQYIVAQRFNSARLDNDQKSHWRNVDNKSMDAALDPQTRRRIRERARFEIANNSYAYGAAMTIANAVIGDGPRLQASFADVTSMASRKSAKLATRVEGEFACWAKHIGLGEKLRAMRFARFQDGEAFALMYNNPRLKTPVQLDIKPFDCERVQSNRMFAWDEHDIDGIKLDDWGNPISYRVLEHHPGGTGYSFIDCPAIAKEYDATRVVHWFRKNTPEQHRGVSEISPGLDILQYLGRYSRAVVNAAEIAADLAVIFYHDDVDDVGGYDVTEFSTAQIPGVANGIYEPEVPFSEMPFSRGTAMTAPVGSKVSQLKAEQPTSTYSMLVDELLGEFGAAIGVPRLILKKSAAGYNYASGRLDFQEYYRFIKLNQTNCEDRVLRPIFSAWFQEWSLLNGYHGPEPITQYFWPGFEHVDPLKEAQAQSTKLYSRTTNLAIEYGRQGRDWEEELTQLARERAKIAELEKEFGVDLSDLTSAPPASGGFEE